MNPNPNYLFEGPINDVVGDYIYHITTEIAQNREQIILRTIQEIGGETYEHITFDKDKVLEALSDYVQKQKRRRKNK